MRLWHIDMLEKIDDKRILSQWREIVAIRGTIRIHGKLNHSTVNYVNNHSISYLYAYALVVADEMIKRGFHANPEILEVYSGDQMAVMMYNNYRDAGIFIYPEHNKEYLKECFENLKKKGVEINYEV